MPSVNPNLALIDQEALRLGIDLKRTGDNTREFIMPGGHVSGKYRTVELAPNGQLIRCRHLEGENRDEVMLETVTTEQIIGLFRTMSGTRP